MIVYDAFNSALTVNELAGQLKGIQLSTTHSRKITNELTIAGWLHGYLTDALDALWFIVDNQSKLTKAIAPVNEYVSSQPDLLLYHSEKFSKV